MHHAGARLPTEAIATAAARHRGLARLPGSHGDAFPHLTAAGVPGERPTTCPPRAAGFRNVVARASSGLYVGRVYRTGRTGPADLRAFPAARRDRL